ncbi:OB-fold domain-containing protein [Saccharopolyspora sp. NPDC050642]|uniref:OB-fold domain-containing protein n=1 Tax=Saccharopolyspora sp. NPDC050642 TaxID=3157099 RepID=UPI0033C53C76
MSIKGAALIAGAYEHPLREIPDKSLAQVHAEVALGAVADAGLTMADVDGYFCAGDAPGFGAISMADHLGLRLSYMDSTETGGSSYLAHVGHAATAIAAGKCHVAFGQHADPREAGRMSSLPAPVPAVNPETKPFWEATTRHELLLKRCDSREAVIWYPRQVCPACSSTATTWFPASGRGMIYSFTVVRRGQGYRGVGPYMLAYVELEEGPRLLTNIVDCNPDDVAIGDPVEVVFHETEQKRHCPASSVDDPQGG